MQLGGLDAHAHRKRGKTQNSNDRKKHKHLWKLSTHSSLIFPELSETITFPVTVELVPGYAAIAAFPFIADPSSKGAILAYNNLCAMSVHCVHVCELFVARVRMPCLRSDEKKK